MRLPTMTPKVKTPTFPFCAHVAFQDGRVGNLTFSQPGRYRDTTIECLLADLAEAVTGALEAPPATDNEAVDDTAGKGTLSILRAVLLPLKRGGKEDTGIESAPEIEIMARELVPKIYGLVEALRADDADQVASGLGWPDARTMLAFLLEGESAPEGEEMT